MLRDQILAFGDDLVGILHQLELFVAVLPAQPHALADDFEDVDDAKRPVAFMRAQFAMIGVIDRDQSVDAGRLRRLELSPKEFALLEFLMRHAGQPVTRTAIVEQVWKLNFDTMTNVVDVYINYLRRKMDTGYDHALIRTVRGVGYQIGGSSTTAGAVCNHNYAGPPACVESARSTEKETAPRTIKGIANASASK